MREYDKIRMWEVRFQIESPLEHFPAPHEIVLERQTSPLYHLEGRGRPFAMAQIVYTLFGEGAFRYGRKIYPLTPGKGFICRLGDPESAYYYPGHATGVWEFLWMDFTGEAAAGMLEEIADRHGHVVDIPPDSGFVQYLNSFHGRKHAMCFVTAAEGAKIVCDAIAQLSALLDREDVVSRGNHLVRAAQTLIAGNLDRAVSLEEVADRLQVSREHLSRVFHERTRMTLRQFAAEERMRCAARMIRDGLCTGGQLAARTGYANAASFARAFRNWAGVSPAQYKKRHSSFLLTAPSGKQTTKRQGNALIKFKS